MKRINLKDQNIGAGTPPGLDKYAPSSQPAHAAAKPGVPAANTPRGLDAMATGETSGNFSLNPASMHSASPGVDPQSAGAEASQAAQDANS